MSRRTDKGIPEETTCKYCGAVAETNPCEQCECGPSDEQTETISTQIAELFHQWAEDIRKANL